MKRLLLILTIASFGSSDCFSQQMDTFLLKDFEVKSLANTPRNVGSTKLNLTPNKFNTLSDALLNQSALFVKQYGTGALATASMRGMGAQHTAIMWNGIYVNSCMNSNLDFNLMPFFLIDAASIETGANAAACGNGAIAGAIHLSNTIENNNQVFANLQAGSFGYYQSGIGANYCSGKFKLKTRILYRKAENDILYNNRFIVNSPLERQKNSAYVQKGFLQELDYKAGSFNSFKMAAWYLESNRELPAAMGVNNLAKERQYDMNTRVVVSHQFKKTERLVVNNKMAVLYDQLNYYNSYYPTSYNQSRTSILESEWLYKINKCNKITASLNNNNSKARTDGYRNWPERNMFSAWLKYEWLNKKENLVFSLGSRFLFVDKQMAPFSPDLAFQYSPLKVLKIKGNVAYSYRVPSFNDYYWQQGGNKNLQPERGFKQELTLEVKQKDFKLAATAFHHVVNNWIKWVPVNGGTYWQAQNAMQVTSSGFELSADYSASIGRHQFQLLGRYQYVESINTKVYKGEEMTLNKQLTYTPYHTGVTTINYQFRNFFFYLTEQFNGSRYTTSENSPNYKLPSYLLTNATAGYQTGYKQHKISLAISANNLLNATYQIMENRPTPLRNYQLTLKFNIINEK